MSAKKKFCQKKFLLKKMSSKKYSGKKIPDIVVAVVAAAGVLSTLHIY